MSVATTNPFALLEAEDPSRPPTPPQPPPTAPAPGRGRSGPASRGGKYYPRGGPVAKPAPEELPDRPRRKFDDQPPRGRGRGRGRGPHRGGADRPDRHSQTGRVDTDKRVHQSWGGDDPVTELKVEQAATNDAAAEATGMNDWNTPVSTPADDPWGAPAATDDIWPASTPDDSATPAPIAEQGEKRRERDVDEEDHTLTLEQYRAKKAEQEATTVPKLEATRAANEGADASIWKDVVELKKGENVSAYFVGKEKPPPKPRAKKEEKVYIEIDGRFERPSRGGDRGRGRGRGDRPPRGGGGYRGRGGGGGGYKPVINDETAFPSLS